MSLPIFKRRLGLLGAAVFGNNENDAGRQRLRTISLSRRYYDRKTDQWTATAISLGEADVSAARKLLGAIESYLLDEQPANGAVGEPLEE